MSRRHARRQSRSRGRARTHGPHSFGAEALARTHPDATPEHAGVAQFHPSRVCGVSGRDVVGVAKLSCEGCQPVRSLLARRQSRIQQQQGRTLVEPRGRHPDACASSLDVSSWADCIADARVRHGTILRVWLPLAGGLLALGWIFQFAPGPHGPARVLGLLLGLIGLSGVILSRCTLGRSFSVVPKATALVTRGIYSRIRNPIYISGEIFLAGLILILWRLD